MNREELVEIMMEHIGETEGIVTMKRTLADRILAALAKEREGEVVVLEDLEVGHDGCIFIADHEYLPTGMAGKRGSLIFRPAKGDR